MTARDFVPQEPAFIGDPQRAAFADSRVLVVDDSRYSRDTIARFLGWIGIGAVEFATDGRSGLRRLEQGRYDLIILGASLADMDPPDLCRQIRANRLWEGLPVLMQTTAASDPAGVKAFEAGASDIISKPINPGECMARVRLHLEKQFFLRNLSDYHRRLEADLRLARSMQLSLIPDARMSASLGERYGLEIEGHFEPSHLLGGDFWTVFELEGDRIGLIVADFSGHGIAAAINTFRFHTLIERIPPMGLDPADWLRSLNRPLKELLPVGQFATCVYVVIDPVAGTLSYAGAGAPSPILVADGKVRVLDASGLMLGVASNPILTTDTLPFPTGASLFLCSDAMAEALDSKGHMIGDDRVTALAQEAGQQEARRLAHMLAGFDAIATRPLADDLTAICVTRRTC